MARTHQWIGLNKKAHQWLINNRAIVFSTNLVDDVFSCIPSYELNIYDTDYGLIEVYIQVEPWSSGPMSFLALRDYKTKIPIQESLWIESSSLYEYVDFEKGFYWC